MIMCGGLMRETRRRGAPFYTHSAESGLRGGDAGLQTKAVQTVDTRNLHVCHERETRSSESPTSHRTVHGHGPDMDTAHAPRTPPPADPQTERCQRPPDGPCSAQPRRAHTRPIS